MKALLIATWLLASAVGVAAEPDGTTPLHRAVYAADADTVKQLIAAGADVKSANQFGITPMALAAVTGDTASSSTLAAVRCQLSSAEGRRRSWCRLRSIEGPAVLKHGADLHARSMFFQNALMWARPGSSGDDPFSAVERRPGERARDRARLAAPRDRRGSSEGHEPRGFHAAAVCRARRLCGLPAGAREGWRGPRSSGSGQCHGPQHGAAEPQLGRRKGPGGAGRGCRLLGYLRPDAAVRRGGHEHCRGRGV